MVGSHVSTPTLDMPAPLPPLRTFKTPRLSFIPGAPKIVQPTQDGKPTVPWIIQLEAEFDPIGGEGQWRFIHYPQDIPFDDYEEFERFCRRHLPVPPDQFSYLMDYLHNFKVLNFDLKSGEVYPAHLVPGAPSIHDRGKSVPIPLAGAPGPYIGGEGT